MKASGAPQSDLSRMHSTVQRMTKEGLHSILKNEAEFDLRSYSGFVFAAGVGIRATFLRDCEVENIVSVLSGFQLNLMRFLNVALFLGFDCIPSGLIYLL